MSLIEETFRTDRHYKDMLEKYSYRDGILAIAFYVVVMIFYYIMGVLYVKRNLNLGYVVNPLLAILCILIVVLRKQKLNTVGFTKRNLSKSLVLGLIPSAIVVAVNVVLGILGGHHLNSVSNLLLNLGYYLFIIAFMEEIIFRGFIQTRIYGTIKKPFLAVAVTGFMFMALHIPFRMGAANMGFLAYVMNNYVTLVFTFIWHIVFNFMYSKYNSIAAPTVFHTFINWSSVIFK